MAEDIRQVAQRSLRPEGERGQTWLFRAFLILLLWVPLPLGSNRPWSWGLMEVYILLLLAAWVGLRLLDYHRDRTVWTVNPTILRYRSAIVLLLLATLYPLWQTIPWPETLLAVISPMTVKLRQLSGVASLSGPISLDLHSTLVEWLKGVAYLGIFWLTLVLTPSRNHLRQLTWILLVSGAIQAGYSLVSIDPQSTLDIRNIQGIRGTFVGPNHLAGFLELLLPVAIGLLLHRKRNDSASISWLDSVREWLYFISGPKAIMAALATSMLLTLFLTHSRSGNAFLLLSVLGVSILSRLNIHKNQKTQRTQQKERFWSKWLIRFLLMIGIVLAGSWVGLGHLMGRYMKTDFHQEERWIVYADTLDIIADYPLFGSGSGTFSFIYPHYQSKALPNVIYVFYDHTHNDYLEILADRGLVGFGFLVTGVVLCWFSLVRAYLSRRDPLACSLLFASLTATLSLSLHGLTDFNFQIPANALYFMVLLAMGLRATTIGPAGSRS